MGLQEATGGTVRLGLGTQVRNRVVRRYGVEFERPGPRLRDFVLAVKACFAGVPQRKAGSPRGVL
jgi:alkanesulfonate monooxygenase SsuD/methylene tetrahydromethanopterin reductase-like flavin-dependent oxidoreductase (luciferase family)